MSFRQKIRFANNPAPDTTPAAFPFTDITGATTNTVFISNPVVISGINKTTPISVTNGYYSINEGIFTNTAGFVNVGDRVRARGLSSSSISTAVLVVVTIGGVSQTFTITTGGSGDSVPDPFSFFPQTAVALSTAITSNSITVLGINTTAVISISGGTNPKYSINGGPFVSVPGNVNLGDSVRVQQLSSASNSVTTVVTLNIGGVTGTFSITTTSGAQALLAPSDLVQLGLYAVPEGNGVGNGYYMGGSFAVRIDGSDTFLYAWGNFDGFYAEKYPLLRFKVPGSPGATLATAPNLIFDHNFGDVRVGHCPTGGSLGSFPSGLLWDETYQGVWWTYGDFYVPVGNYPTLAFTKINTDNTWTTYGPWRIRADGPRFVGGYLSYVPSAYQAGLGGKEMCVGGVVYSGATGCPQGPDLHVFTRFNPITTPASTTLGADMATTVFDVMHYPVGHEKTRPANYSVCGWSPGAPGGVYDCRYSPPPPLSAPNGFWANLDAATSLDIAGGHLILNTTSRRGVVHFGQLVATPPGYVAPGPDGKVHGWYGNKNHVDQSGSGGSGFVNGACCHLQSDPWWGTTGPGAHYRQGTGWISDPSQLALSYATTIQPWGWTFAHDAFTLQDHYPAYNKNPPTSPTDYSSPRDGWCGNLSFDSVNNLIYASIQGDVVTGASIKPFVAVFSVPA